MNSTHKAAHYQATFSDDSVAELDGDFGLTHAWRVKGLPLGGGTMTPVVETGFTSSMWGAKAAADVASKDKHVTSVEIVETVATSNTDYNPTNSTSKPSRKF